MERIRALNGYQRILLILLSIMLIVFAVIYPCTVSQRGYLYQDKLFLPEQIGTTTVYSAKLNGLDSVFTVEGDTVTFHWGDTVYGPYTVTEDPSVVPSDHEFTQGMIIRLGDEILFQGGVYMNDWVMLFNQDGSLYFDDEIITYPDGGMDMEPPLYAIIELAFGPELTNRGSWMGFLGGIFLSILCVIDILFADELFRFRISFRVSDPDSVDPSDWEIASWYIGWTSIAILILICYMKGLFPI